MLDVVSGFSTAAKKLFQSASKAAARLTQGGGRRPLEAVTLGLLFLSAAALYPDVFSEDLTSFVKDFNFEITVFLLLALASLAGRHRDLFTSESADQPTSTRHKVFVGGIVTLLIGACAAIRFVHLSALDPYTDETAHLQYALSLMEGVKGRTDRAAFVSHLVRWFWELGHPTYFAQYIFLSRIPGVLFSALTLIPLYFVGLRISRPVALISCVLWVLCPWAIGVSRYVREYAFFPFFILLALHSFFFLYEAISTAQFSKRKIRFFANLAVIVGIAVYSIWIDYQSTMKVTLIVLAAAGTCVGILRYRKLLASEGRTLLKVGIAVAGAAAIAAAGFVLNSGAIAQLGYGINPRFVPVFFSAASYTPVLWWTGMPLEKIAVFFVALAFFGAPRRTRNFYIIFSVFVLLFAFYYFFFSRYFRPRYAFYILPFFILIAASGIHNLFAFARVYTRRIPRIGAFLVISFFVGSTVFSYDNIAKALVFKAQRAETNNGFVSGYFSVTGEYHQNMQGVLRYLEDHYSADDVFVTTVFYPVLQLELKVPRRQIAYYPSKKKNHISRLKKKIRENDRGWIVLDSRRFGAIDTSGFPIVPGATTRVEGKKVRLMYAEDEARIYLWKKPNKKK